MFPLRPPAALLALAWCLAVPAAVSHASSPAPRPPSPSATPTATPAAATTIPSRQVAVQLLAAINKDRKAHHVRRLTLDTHESTCSFKHSRHMASLGIISHDQFPADVCVPYSSTAENVGEAYGDPAAAVLTLHRLMMAEGPCPDRSCLASEFAAHGHYANLVNPIFTRIGIGIYVRDAAVWLTEDFIGAPG